MSLKEDFVKELIADPTPYKKFSKTFSDDDKKSEQVNYDASVTHPDHYRPGTYEAINVIKAWDLNFALGNAVKYICRAGIKDPEKEIEDLRKAIFYLQTEIEERQSHK